MEYDISTEPSPEIERADRSQNDPEQVVSTSTVAELVKRHPGNTSRELAAFGNLCRIKVARRLPEAANMVRRKPQVYKGESRKCRISGRMAITWWDREVPR